MIFPGALAIIPFVMKVKCPKCGEELEWEDSQYRPFCSSRCKFIDLGAWANEEFKVPVEIDIDLEEINE